VEHTIYRVVGFEKAGPYILTVRFDDGSEQTIDFGPVLTGSIYGPLADEKMFDQVEIDPEIHTLVWPSGADFDPETLHNWPDYAVDMARLVSVPESTTSQTM